MISPEELIDPLLPDWERRWHGEVIEQDDDEWAYVQWFRGRTPIGPPELTNLHLDGLARTTDYFNWLDQYDNLPFDSNGGYRVVHSWMDAARQSGMRRKYLKSHLNWRPPAVESLAARTVGTLLDSEAEEFYQDFSNTWTCQAVQHDTGYFYGQWYRGFIPMGIKETYLSQHQIDVLTDYVNWLDQRSPYSSRGNSCVSEWLSGNPHFSEYLKTPQGRKIVARKELNLLRW